MPTLHRPFAKRFAHTAAHRAPDNRACRRAHRADADNRESRSPCRPSSAGYAMWPSVQSKSPETVLRSNQHLAYPSTAEIAARRQTDSRHNGAGLQRTRYRTRARTFRSRTDPSSQSVGGGVNQGLYFLNYACARRGYEFHSWHAKTGSERITIAGRSSVFCFSQYFDAFSVCAQRQTVRIPLIQFFLSNSVQ